MPIYREIEEVERLGVIALGTCHAHVSQKIIA